MKPEIMPVKMPWEGRDVPHITIELTQACNISCHGCYKDRFAFMKALEQVKEELEIARKERNLEAVTLLGGEPCLHPDLTSIIGHVTSLGIRTILLTNATLLTPEKLRAWKAAGLCRVAMHIDRHQHGRPDSGPVSTERELHGLRETYVNMCRDAGVEPALALTLYRDTLDEFADILDFCHRKNVGGILCTTYTQIMNAESRPEDNLSTNCAEVYRHFADKVNARPSWFVPSTHHSDELRWLFYTAAVFRHADGSWERRWFDPRFPLGLRLIPWLTRRRNGRHRFEEGATPAQSVVGFLLIHILALNLRYLFGGLGFLLRAARAGNIRMFTIVFQQPPVPLPNNEYDACRNCPDATVRDGRIIPVCIADKVAPLRG